jgi:hypothetical protein
MVEKFTGGSQIVSRPIESPRVMIERDLHQSLKLQQEVRDMIKGQIKIIRMELGTQPSKNVCTHCGRGAFEISERLEINQKLASLTDTLTKSIQNSAKMIFTLEGGAEGAAKKDEINEASLIEEMVGRR